MSRSCLRRNSLTLSSSQPPSRIATQRHRSSPRSQCSVYVRLSTSRSCNLHLTCLPPLTSHVPSVVIASFGDPDTHTPETKFVKASGGLNLGMLHAIHGVYRDVIHDEISVEDGSIALEKMLKAKPIYNLWQRMLIAAMCAGIIAPLG